ncbi:type VI secretion system baseplate subunit TssF [Uliginosibacterium aquaticum]|uniref:Type VI secretion system baseplate subunit TssF n=1 Tax=Uliginosibacterium aquaticum TaxID=2731212 RepID=A0ABX2ISY0_9RHOO|nr:type VI secretion system baseplate subunit TssF [Uliginosibacterium aquaticum]NSL57085.1 type VI secretion system baseplate subunit TssF [Uliginosibacterium aquaticum]
MRDLLPYYEQELTFLRRHAREFAQRYPKVASRLLISGDSCEDPHVERMIESFALLSARVQKKLDDDFPEFTSSFIDVLYPHYLRPLPACSIARFDLGGADAQLSGISRIERGSQLTTRPVKGISCKFRTAFDVALSSLRIESVGYAESFTPPRGFTLPTGSAALLSIGLSSASEQLPLGSIELQKLRCFIDGESSQVEQIREALLSRSLAIVLEIPGEYRWHRLGAGFTQAVGFGLSEELFDYDARSHLAYRLLSEFFAFPEKFNFVDFDYAALRALLPPGIRRCSLHFILGSQHDDSRDARLLERVSTSNILTHCTPVVNLFDQNADPIRVTHTKSSYPVVPDARRAHAFELYAIKAVCKVEKTSRGEAVLDYRPYYALRHGENLENSGRFWHLRRDEQVAELSPGFEYEISVVDLDFDTRAEKTETLSIELTCTNRDLPAQLPFGMAGGDLFMEGGSLARSISLLRKPSQTVRIDRSKSHWRLISHLSLGQLSLTEAGLETLKETLALYDLTRSPVTRKLIDGLQSISHQVVTARIAGNPFPSFVKGVEIRLGVNTQHFVGTSVEQFARLLDHFFGLYVHTNSFTQLVVCNHENGEEITRCLPRNGDQTLV